MNYSTTYVGIIVVVLGWLGASHLVTEGEVSLVVDNILQLIGVVTAIWGRYKAGGVSVLGVKN